MNIYHFTNSQLSCFEGRFDWFQFALEQKKKHFSSWGWGGECTKTFKGKLSYSWAVENGFRFFFPYWACIYFFNFFLLFNKYKWKRVAVSQLYVIIVINVGYKFFHFAFISDLISHKFSCSISSGSLIILNIILTYKITEVILEGGFIFVFCKRESKYIHILNSSFNTSVSCRKTSHKPGVLSGLQLCHTQLMGVNKYEAN